MIAKLDAKGLEIEQVYLDAAGGLAKHAGGYARRINIYDDRGTLVDAKFFDLAPLSVKPLVMHVAPSGQGARLGLKEGDILLRYGGEETLDSVRFTAARRNEKTDGQQRELVVRRGEKVLTFQISPGLLGIVLNDQVMPAAKDHDTEKTKDAKHDGEKVSVW